MVKSTPPEYVNQTDTAHQVLPDTAINLAQESPLCMLNEMPLTDVLGACEPVKRV